MPATALPPQDHPDSTSAGPGKRKRDAVDGEARSPSGLTNREGLQTEKLQQWLKDVLEILKRSDLHINITLLLLTKLKLRCNAFYLRSNSYLIHTDQALP